MKEFSFTTNDTLHQAATLGLIVLKADETIELDFRKLLPRNVAIHVSRVQSDADVTVDSLMKMKSRLTDAASLLPSTSNFDCVAYACTSAASVIGPKEVASRIRDGCRTKSTSDPVTALVSACEFLGIQNLAILSPYVENVSIALRNALSHQKIATPEFGSFNESSEAKVVRIDENSIISASTNLVGSADALFISCTNLRTLGIIEKIEGAIGKPVLTSNQVLAWHMAKSAGIDFKCAGFGQLLKSASLKSYS